MTNRDIRDIASYWSAPVQVIAEGIVQSELITVDWSLLKDIAFLSTVGIEHKVCLRRIASLSDDEVIKCVEIIDGEPVYIYTKPNIRRSSGFIMFTHGNGRPVYIRTRELIEDDGITGRCNPKLIEITSYLQSIGVWVPGTISEKYVQLIES